jgi:hypothetical protein
MTLLAMEGFDHFTSAQITDKDIEAFSSPDVNSNYGRFSGQGCHCASQSAYFTINFGVNKSTIYMGAGFKKADGGIPLPSTSYPWLRFSDESGVQQILLCVNAAMGIDAYRNTTLLGSTADTALPDLKWCYLEAKIIISATVGEVTLRVNGNQILNLTSQNTKNGSDYIRRIQFCGIYSGISVWYDDIYIDDAQFHGDCRIRTFMPDSISGTNNDFTASAGNKNECVDEVQTNEDTDYITSDTVNNKQTFGITTGSVGTVKGIQLNNHCRLDEAGTRKITPLIRSNSTNYSGTETDNISAEYKFEHEIWETDPDDSNAWTQTKLEAAEFGLEITT